MSHCPSSFLSTAHLLVDWHSCSISCELLYQPRTNEKSLWMLVLLKLQAVLSCGDEARVNIVLSPSGRLARNPEHFGCFCAELELPTAWNYELVFSHLSFSMTINKSVVVINVAVKVNLIALKKLHPKPYAQFRRMAVDWMSNELNGSCASWGMQWGRSAWWSWINMYSFSCIIEYATLYLSYFFPWWKECFVLFLQHCVKVFSDRFVRKSNISSLRKNLTDGHTLSTRKHQLYYFLVDRSVLRVYRLLVMFLLFVMNHLVVFYCFIISYY